jgi:ubiquinone/menaquinone biosynthesis C-methylase UbiE
MGSMSGLEKWFVNRSSERRSKGILRTVQNHIRIPDSAGILEIGAGRGSLSYLAYQQYKPRKLVVTDYDPSQVGVAKAQFASKLGTLPPDVEFTSADAVKLPFEDEIFDLVFTINVLHHVGKGAELVEAESKAVSEVRRVLKTGGYFVYGEIFNKDLVRNLLTRAGFRPVFAKRYLFFRDLAVYQKTDG